MIISLYLKGHNTFQFWCRGLFFLYREKTIYWLPMVGIVITHLIFPDLLTCYVYIPVLALVAGNGSFKSTNIVNKNMRESMPWIKWNYDLPYCDDWSIPRSMENWSIICSSFRKGMCWVRLRAGKATCKWMVYLRWPIHFIDLPAGKDVHVLWLINKKSNR